MSEQQFLTDLIDLIRLHIQTQLEQITDIQQSISTKVEYEDWERIHQFLVQNIPLKIKTPELVNQIEIKWKEGLITFKRTLT